MKRKTLDDFYTPIKKLKQNPEFIKCELCGDSIYSNSISFHDCTSQTTEKKQKTQESIPEIFKLLMSTSQSTIKSNFYLEYLGKINERHQFQVSLFSHEIDLKSVRK